MRASYSDSGLELFVLFYASQAQYTASTHVHSACLYDKFHKFLFRLGKDYFMMEEFIVMNFF